MNLQSLASLPRTVDLQFTADYFINMRWYDHRLQFKDLNDKSILNGVNTLDLIKIWSPELKFLNALGPYQTVIDDLNVCTIILEHPPTFDDYSKSVECKYKVQAITFCTIHIDVFMNRLQLRVLGKLHKS